jgi:adenylate cyclase
MSELSVPLEEIAQCLQGVIPSWLATCSADGVPNITILSIVHYVDQERVALTRQFFNKTTANLDANPWAQVVVVDPLTADQFLLELRFLHTETEGATFDAVAANLDAIASQAGMHGVFRLRGVDIHRVLSCTPFGERLTGAPGRGSEQRMLATLEEYVRRLAGCVDYAEATRVGLAALEDLFGFGHSILLVFDERGDRLFAVASNGYPASSAGAEVPLGVGLIGVAAQRRTVVCVPSLARSRAMQAAIKESLRQSGAELPAREIPLPGLDGVQSAAAVPLVVRNALTGVLYLESARAGDFGPGDERLLGILGGHLAAALSTLEGDRRESPSRVPAPPSESPAGEKLGVVYYQADDSVFANGEYVIKGVPGRILWTLLNEHAASGRTSFTNRELRLDERLGLPPGNDNLEARLLVLRKRLASADCGIELQRVGRGRLELRVSRPAALSEVRTSGPMRAAFLPPQAAG